MLILIVRPRGLFGYDVSHRMMPKGLSDTDVSGEGRTSTSFNRPRREMWMAGSSAAMTRKHRRDDKGGVGPVVLIVALLVMPLFVHDAYFLHVLILIGINVMVAVSMWLLGITGLISFGQAGFMFIGAMTTALLTKLLHWPFWVALPLSAVIPALDRRARWPAEPARARACISFW